MTGLASRPRIGDAIAWPDDSGVLATAGRVVSIDGNLAWMEYPDGTKDPFIWRFHDGLNSLATVMP